MNQYIITYDELIELIEFGWDIGYNTQILVHKSNIMSCPYQSERDKVLDTDSVLAVLKKRYHNEMAILDYIEMIECEVMALRQKVNHD
jgi:hypothetical protein